MSELPRVQFDGRNATIDLGNQEQCMKYIFDQVIPSCIEGSKGIDEGVITFRKVTKNNNIKQTIDKLEQVDSHYICLYSYGQHIGKMLTVLEILKRLLLERVQDAQKHVQQWNRLTSFTVTQEGRNELLEKSTRVPIFITLIAVPSSAPHVTADLALNGFTQQ